MKVIVKCYSLQSKSSYIIDIISFYWLPKNFPVQNKYTKFIFDCRSGWWEVIMKYFLSSVKYY